MKRVETSAQVTPVVDRVFYGVGKFIENRTPVAHQEQIIYLINRFIIPKLSPKQMEWVGKHKDAIETVAIVAGVGVTTAEITAAVVVGARLTNWARSRLGASGRSFEQVPKPRAGAGVKEGAYMLVGGTAAFGFSRQMLEDLRDEIDHLSESNNGKERRRAEQMRKVWSLQLRELELKEEDELLEKEEQIDGKLVAIGRNVDIKLRPEWVVEQANKLAANVETSKEQAEYSFQFEKKMKADIDERKHRKQYLITLASELGKGIVWRSPELAGVLEEARQMTHRGDPLETYDLARLLDTVDEAAKRDPLIKLFLTQMALAKRYGDREILMDTAVHFLDQIKHMDPVASNRHQMSRLASHWVIELDASGIELLESKPDVDQQRRYVSQLISQGEPRRSVEMILREIAKVSDYDENMPFVVRNVAERGPMVMDDDNGKIAPSNELKELLRRGYRLLLNRTEEEQIQWDKIKAEHVVTYEHTLTNEEEKALTKLGFWIVTHNPGKALRLILKGSKFEKIHQWAQGHSEVDRETVVVKTGTNPSAPHESYTPGKRYRKK